MSNKYTSVYDWLKYIKANVVGINLRELRLNNMIRYIEANSSTIINKWYMQFGKVVITMILVQKLMQIIIQDGKITVSTLDRPVRHILAVQVHIVALKLLLHTVARKGVDIFSIDDGSFQGRRDNASPQQILWTLCFYNGFIIHTGINRYSALLLQKKPDGIPAFYILHPEDAYIFHPEMLLSVLLLTFHVL